MDVLVLDVRIWQWSRSFRWNKVDGIWSEVEEIPVPSR